MARASTGFSIISGGGSSATAVTSTAVIADNRIVRGDGGARGIQDSAVTIDDSGNVTGAPAISATTSLNAGTPTTADANADSMIAASATGKKALVVQAKALATQPPFEVQTSTGASVLMSTTDGSLIINQRTAAVYAEMLDVKYQNTTQASIRSDGLIYTRVGANFGGGFFTTDASGNATALGNLSGKHLMSNGTSPTVTGDGTTNGTIAGKDSFCKVTVGTGVTTTIVITFGTAWATAPVVVVNAQTTTTPINVASTTTTATLTCAAFTAGEVLHVVCGGF